MLYSIYNGVGFYDTDELKHYGIKGMKWGVRRHSTSDGSLTDAGKRRQRHIAAKAKSSIRKESKNEYQKERERQKKYLATKRAIDLGSRAVNEYTKRHNVTINGMHAGVPDSAKAIVNKLLDYKYMKDTFK